MALQSREHGEFVYHFRPLAAKFGLCHNQVVVRAHVFVFVWVLLMVFGPVAKAGTTDRPVFSFDEYLLAPLRIHLLSATNAAAIQTTLTESDRPGFW